MGMTPTQRNRGRSITSELGTVGPILPGTVSCRETVQRGRANCRCNADPLQLHGPYLVVDPQRGRKDSDQNPLRRAL